MIKYQLTLDGYNPIFVLHLGESGDDRLLPIFETTIGSEAILNWFILPEMKSVRLSAMRTWSGVTPISQTELDVIMRSPQLEPWQPLLIEGLVQAPSESPSIDPLQQD